MDKQELLTLIANIQQTIKNTLDPIYFNRDLENYSTEELYFVYGKLRALDHLVYEVFDRTDD